MEIFNSVDLNFYFAFEFLGFISFVIILAREIYQKNKIRIFEIFSCLAFGMILEIGNTYLAHTYYYSQEFLVKIFNVPLAIGFGWVTIIYCAMLLSDQYNIPWTLRPFMDALTAIILDLSLDTIAIRLGFWHWAIPLDQEWYGVPFENLVGWILVVLSFSFIVRYLRTLNFDRSLTRIILILSPLLAYVFLILGLLLFSAVTILPYTINNWSALLSFNYSPDFSMLYNPSVQFWKLIFFVTILIELINIVVWSVIKYRKNYLWRFDILSFSILSSMHIFFFIALFITKIYQQLPILVFLSAGMLLAHLAIHLLPYIFNPKVVYVFEGIKKSISDEQNKIEKVLNESLK